MQYIHKLKGQCNDSFLNKNILLLQKNAKQMNGLITREFNYDIGSFDKLLNTHFKGVYH